jgi:hypothetical protein
LYSIYILNVLWRLYRFFFLFQSCLLRTSLSAADDDVLALTFFMDAIFNIYNKKGFNMHMPWRWRRKQTNKKCATLLKYIIKGNAYSQKWRSFESFFSQNRRRYSQPAAEHYTIYLTIDTSLKNNRRKLLFEIFALLILEGGWITKKSIGQF